MKKDRITKLYDGLSPHELAALAFERCMFNDEVEADRIFDAVPLKTYEVKDYRYMERLNGCHLVTLYFGMYYWQNLCRRYAASTVLLNEDEALEERHNALALVKKSDSKLLALDDALAVICEKYGISEQAVRRHTDTWFFSQKGRDTEADDEFYGQMMGLFENIMKRAE